MTPAENIKNLIKNTKIKTNPEVNKAVLNDLLNHLDKTQTIRSAIHQPNIWRIIMNSKITKLAAAAVIIIAVLIGINQFTGSIDGAAIAFAEITEAVKKVEWMHVFIIDEKNPVSVPGETWVSFGSHIIVKIREDGGITFEAYSENKQYVYVPDTKTITISHMTGKPFLLGAAAPFELFEKLLQDEQNKGAKITRETGQYNQAKVEIWEVTKSEQGVTVTAKLFIDIHKHLPTAMELRVSRNGTVVQDNKMNFEYPENGPKDIFDLGVPHDVKIITNSPNEE